MHLAVKTAAIALASVFCITAQIIIDPPVILPLYPRADLSPTAPTIDDTVKLRYVLGLNPDGCVPRYITSFKVTNPRPIMCLVAPCPQNYLITVSYKISPIQPLIACLMVPTEYGPTFNFGKLDIGLYTVVDSTGKDTLAQFTVTEKTVALRDSVTWTPLRPNVRDTIAFSLFDADACCCAAFHNQTASLINSAIYLDYDIDSRSCALCDCAGVGRWLDFKMTPLPAGTYDIYSAGQTYCPPGSICPAIVILPVKVGSITVTRGVGVSSAIFGARMPVTAVKTATYDILGRKSDAAKKSTGVRITGSRVIIAK